MTRWIFGLVFLISLSLSMAGCAEKSVRNPSNNDPSTKSWTKDDRR